ncbi:fatty acid-binding protein DegV-like protein [Mycoplasmopsis canis UFG4]|uniref:Fatty acid-binding protein DegV-like protein n=1 Tax=Mycoplasmopsis canis UFG4 TaxID=1131455 RepID=I1A7H9_9BACT|nr:DegV family protein [Mycoplasmopsis canis]EIE42450.1 fatty acid-binding protein DegV-like protein [Mycoplasmopsis canis UFG4]
MKDLAIVVDSACGLDEKQAELYGYYFLPLQIEIDNVTYNDGIDLTAKNFFEKFSLKSENVKTSATPLGYSKNLLEQLSKEYKRVVVFPISTKLSSQYNSLNLIAQDFDNVFIVESVDVAQTILFRVDKFLETYKKEGFEKAFEISSKWIDDEMDITLLPKYNDYLVKGGRLSKSAAALAKLLQIVPFIRFTNGSLEKQGKGRVFNKSLQNVVDEKMQNQNEEDQIIILGEKNSDVEALITYIQSTYKIQSFTMPIPNVISIHTGPEAVVIIKGPKLKDKMEKYLK